MKKRYALLLTGLLTLSLAAGCGAKTDNAGETSAPAVSESQAAESTEQTADVQNTADQGEEKTITGTIDEIKDFMFIITDESGAAYEFSFETAPEGLENVAGGPPVVVNAEFVMFPKEYITFKKSIKAIITSSSICSFSS